VVLILFGPHSGSCQGSSNYRQNPETIGIRSGLYQGLSKNSKNPDIQTPDKALGET